MPNIPKWARDTSEYDHGSLYFAPRVWLTLPDECGPDRAEAEIHQIMRDPTVRAMVDAWQLTVSDGFAPSIRGPIGPLRYIRSIVDAALQAGWDPFEPLSAFHARRGMPPAWSDED